VSCLPIIQVSPRHSNAWYNYPIVLDQLGRHEELVPLSDGSGATRVVTKSGAKSGLIFRLRFL